ncbi:hypothetical protein QWJ90_02930 [Microbacterium oryzae]|uniref:hypothetical protein n=1 Tax=Microbacterium oryzae TaxID=743009 RepID=UPI0025B25052|nr:hypothetical protein [Microbacterium oryzae]MDN3309879.1 hypothetical protein [Microbacterium oryzae]
MSDLDALVGRWRSQRAGARGADADAAEAAREERLRAETADLRQRGLAVDEAFLVALRRVGDLDALQAEIARERPSRRAAGARLGFVLTLAALAGLATRGAVWLLEPGGPLVPTSDDGALLLRTLPLVVAPFLLAYLLWTRRPGRGAGAVIAAGYLLVALCASIFPFAPFGDTAVLTAIHAPVALWALVGVAYVAVGGRPSRRIEFARFSGEVAVLLALIGLGGGALLALMIGSFAVVGVELSDGVLGWILALGAPGALLIATWLVDRRQSVAENIAPVLARVFTPLTGLMLLALLVVVVTAGDLARADRELLIVMDLVLVLVLALSLYAVSARDPRTRVGLLDAAQLVMLIAAVAVDVVVLAAMLTRIAEFGFSANKTAALGLNLLLLVHLAGQAALTARLLLGRTGPGALERWPSRWLPAYGVWAVVVVAVFPPLFGFM